MWKILGYALIGLEAGLLFVILFEPGGTKWSRINDTTVVKYYSPGSSGWAVVLMLIVPTLAGAWIGWNRRKN